MPKPQRFEDRGPLRIAGLRARYTYSTMSGIPAQWQSLMNFSAVPGQVGRAGYGVVFDQAGGDSSFDYLAGFEVAGSSELPAEFSVANIAAHRYAVFPHPGHLSTLQETIRPIWRQWLPTSGYEVDRTGPDTPGMLEIYGEDFDPRTGRGGIELWLPVREHAHVR